MPWTKSSFLLSSMPQEHFFSLVLGAVSGFVCDPKIHGDDAWELVHFKDTPNGIVFKVHNRMPGEYGYMALMEDHIRVGSTYWNWLKQDDVLRKTFAYGKDGLNLSFYGDIAVSGGQVAVYSRDSNSVDAIVRLNPDGTVKEKIKSTNYRLKEEHRYYFNPQPEIFASDADVVFFSMFKQFEEKFDWTEWMGNERKSIKIKPLKYYDTHGSSTYPSLFDPPLYPGVGSPAIGYSPTFFDKPWVNENQLKDVTIYTRKDRHSLTFVINCLDYWEVASVGFFEAFDTMGEYAFPAYTMGGTSGVLPLTELCSYGGSPRVEHGFRLDYTEANWSLSHGHPGYASTWWDGSQNFLDNYMYSQVQAMLPDGRWQSFASYGLQQEAYYNRSRGQYFSAHKEPQRIMPKYYLMPGQCDLLGLQNPLPSTTIMTKYYSDKPEARNYKRHGLLPMYLVACPEPLNQNILGVLPNIYWCTQPVTRYGEHVIDGKTYLIIPNAWEKRKYHIKNYFSVLLGESQDNARQLAEIERLDRLSSNMNCAILLD